MTEDFNQKLDELKKLIEDSFKNLENDINQRFSEVLSAMDRIVEDVSKLKKEKEFEREQAVELSELIKETAMEEKIIPKETISPPIEQKPKSSIEKTPKSKQKPQPPIKEIVEKVQKPSKIKQKPAVIKPSQPEEIAEKAEAVPSEVHKIFDGISDAVISKISAKELFDLMNQARDSIIKVYRWHPVLYELASFARRVQKLSEDQPLDNEISTLLIEKINDWKNRIVEE